MSDTFNCALRELKRRKSRALFNIIGYCLAVTLIILLGHVLLFVKEAENAVLLRTGTHFIAFTPSCREGTVFTNGEIEKRIAGDIPLECKSKFNECLSCTKKPLDPSNEAFIANTVVTRLLPFQCVETAKKLASVKDASPYLLFRFKDRMDGHLFSVGGFDPKNTFSVYTTCCSPNHVINGVFLKMDERGNALLEEAYAIQRNLKVDDNIIISGLPFKIVGIVRPGSRPAKADVYLTIDDARMAINKRLRNPLANEINVILIEAVDSTKVDNAIGDIKQNLAGGVATSFACSIPAARIFGLNEESAIVLIAVIFIGAIVLSMKSQMASVLERKREIGILKAIGWTNYDVVNQIFIESFIQSFIGGIFGCLFSAIVIILVPLKQMSGIDTQLDIFLYPLLFIAGIIFNLLAGIFSGIIPALNAAKTKPYNALL